MAATQTVNQLLPLIIISTANLYAYSITSTVQLRLPLIVLWKDTGWDMRIAPAPTEATAHVAHTGLDMDWVTKEADVYSALLPQPTVMLAKI